MLGDKLPIQVNTPFFWRNGRPSISKSGCHGGTINDIGIHAFDIIPWLTMTHLNADHVRVVRDADEEPVLIPAVKSPSRCYLEDFLHGVEGRSESASLTTNQVIAASREALEAQGKAGP